VSETSELNLSALSGGVVIDLAQGAGTVNGQALGINAGVDRVVGSATRDVITGSAQNETLNGGRGVDWLFGGAGDDRLDGGEDNDLLFADAGRDLLIAGAGSDTLWGGAVGDVFLVEDGQVGTTTIKDFNAATGDTLLIRTPQALTWNAISQTVAGGNLTINFNGSGATHAIVLEGVTTLLADGQLRGIGALEEVAIDPDNGGYTGQRIIAVKPDVTTSLSRPDIKFSYYNGPVNWTNTRVAFDTPGYRFFHVSEN